jgi:hypothetical protein
VDGRATPANRQFSPTVQAKGVGNLIVDDIVELPIVPSPLKSPKPCTAHVAHELKPVIALMRGGISAR